MDDVQRRVQSLFTEIVSLISRVEDVTQSPRRDKQCIAQWRERLEGVMVLQWELGDFARPFISLFCMFGLQLTKLRDAGTEEVEYLAFTLGCVILGGLAASAEVVDSATDEELPESLFEGSRAPVSEDKEATDFREQCTWRGNLLISSVFTLLFGELCAELPKFACGVLRKRLVDEGYLAEFVQVAEWRASAAKQPLHLHMFDLVISPVNERPSELCSCPHG